MPAGRPPVLARDLLGGRRPERHDPVDRPLRRLRARGADPPVLQQDPREPRREPAGAGGRGRSRDGDQFALDLRFLHTESEGPIFDEVEANLAAVASQMGMSDVFRLRGVDIHRVLLCEPFGEHRRARGEERGPERDVLPLLDEFVRRLALCTDYAEAARVGLEALDDLLGFAYSVLLTADERGDRLFAVASTGYVPSGVGAEVPVGVGLVGVAAERRRVVCIPSLARSRAMNAAVQESIRRSGADSGSGRDRAAGPGASAERRGRSPARPRRADRGALPRERAGGRLRSRQGASASDPRRAARRRARDPGGGSRRERRRTSRAGGDRRRGSRSRSPTTRRTTASSSTTSTWSKAYRAGSSGSCCASTRPTGAPRSPTGSCGSTSASGCRRATTTSRRGCSSCANASRRSSAGSRSTGSTAAGSRSVSRAPLTLVEVPDDRADARRAPARRRRKHKLRNT